MTVTKAQLTEQRRGKGGTLVVLRRDYADTLIPKVGAYADPHEVLVVKDLMERKNYSKPNRIGVGPLWSGIAFGVELDQVELANDHPADCAFCGVLSGEHVYVSPETQARRVKAAEATNARWATIKA